MASFGDYEIYITDSSFPALEESYVEVEVGAGVYTFRRSLKNSQVFNISGYISQESMQATHEYAKALNDDLIANPSGILVDGYNDTYEVFVNSWEIKPVPAQNKYVFTMNLRIVNG